MFYTTFNSRIWPKMFSAMLAVAVLPFDAHADKLSRAIDRMAKEAVKSGEAAGLSIAVDRGGEMIFEKGYGFADIENQVEATPETIYRIGSVTKQFTAVAIVQLEAAGELKLDQPITEVISEYPALEKPVTIRHLLNHTCGIRDFTRDPSHRPNAGKDMTHPEMLARFASYPLEFSPGSKWQYSNSGYYLLGMIIERASGMAYGEYMEKHVLAPAAMTQSRYGSNPGPSEAKGYEAEGGKLAPAPPISMTQPFAAGALVSTVGDLVKWQRALVEGRLTPADAFGRITKDVMDTGRWNEAYGYGIRVATRGGRRVISHGGGIEGFCSALAYYPESDHTIAILANTAGFDIRRLHEEIEAVVFGQNSESEQ